MEALSEVWQLLKSFDNDELSAVDFVQAYAAMWTEIVREQDEAIAAQPAVDQALNDLRRRFSDGDITPDQYLEGVREPYSLLSGVRLRPDSPESQALGRLFVRADAFSDQPSPDGTEDELHASVREALKVFQSR